MPNSEILTGNQAMAQGVKLSRVQVISAYPITPQTTIVEELAKYVACGELDAQFVNVESEHSAISVVTGAELTGARSFTATSSQGLGYMVEGLVFVHGFRLPLVIGVASRSLGAPYGTGGADYSDIMTVRDFGFIQFYVENNQEALDTIIQAYRIAEDPRVLLPVMVDIDGFYLSFSSETVSVPEQKEVDHFLPPYKAEHVIIDPENPMAMVISGPHSPHIEKEIEDAMLRACSVIKQVDKEFGVQFGRTYGGMVEGYRCEDAEIVFITIGSMTGTAREAVDLLCDEGIRVGLLKIRVFRPFPQEEIALIAKNIEDLIVIDRNVSHGGSNTGIISSEVKTALYDLGLRPNVHSFIAGLGGNDINVGDFKKMVYQVKSMKKVAAEAQSIKGSWLLPQLPKPKKLVPRNPELLIYPGISSCAGCTAMLLFRHTLETAGKDTVLIVPPGCIPVVSMVGWSDFSPLRIPSYMAPFPATASTAVGIRHGLYAMDKPNTLVLGIAGDGGTADIGLQALSGAAHRKEAILYICYDNEAYMNTGIQKSGTTPFTVKTSTTPVTKTHRGNPTVGVKDMPRIMAAHDVNYIATASVAYLRDYKKKLTKAMNCVRDQKELAYVHVHCPCPPGWGFSQNMGIHIAKLAVQSRMWNLFEVENGKVALTVKVSKPAAVNEYTRLQGRYAHITEEELSFLQEAANAKFERLLNGIL